VNPQIQVGKPAITAEEPLLAEIKSFCNAFATGPSVVSLKMERMPWNWPWRFFPRSTAMPVASE